jgi:hypothetical protein
MTVRGDAAAVSNALEGIRSSLLVDGYTIDVSSASAEGVQVSVGATENACAECLAPTEVLKMIICGQLDGAYQPDEVDLALPARGH